jgi:hypothetical protein
MQSKGLLCIIIYPVKELIYALFNDIVSTLDYTATNDWTINECPEKMWTEAAGAYLKVLSVNTPKWMDKDLWPIFKPNNYHLHQNVRFRTYQ